MSVFRFLPESLKERIRHRLGAVTPLARLKHLRQAGFQARHIIDAGAYLGDWTRLILSVYPEAEVLMIEPQQELRSTLAPLAASNPRVRLRQALLGARPETVSFVNEASNSRILPRGWSPSATTKLEERQVETLLAIAEEEGFADCNLLKLDLQGHELEALGGAGPIFGQCEVIITEVSWLPIGNPPLAHEVIQQFVARGYRLYDVFGLNHGAKNGALWQTDFTFVRTDSRLIAAAHQI
jgi:FkbM family methyltransferase